MITISELSDVTQLASCATGQRMRPVFFVRTQRVSSSIKAHVWTLVPMMHHTLRNIRLYTTKVTRSGGDAERHALKALLLIG